MRRVGLALLWLGLPVNFWKPRYKSRFYLQSILN
ncbi:unnamed protein product [Brassica napus]|uniref:(rape) hypothetical protein n=1 Tax=Brassica napus TaxID=3708 RepID=A0A816N407_BRANA|nr:unnamed protein product [Brassica napus]